MVWCKVKKVIACMAVCLLLACCASATANAASIYDGSISSSYVDYASRIPISLGDEYVFFRDSQYGYTLVTGDLVYQNGNFSLNGTGKQYNFDAVTSGSYGSVTYYTFTTTDISTFNLATNNRLVYSSLGNYPTLYERGVIYEEITLLVLCIGFVCYIVRSLFSFLLRYRGRNG